VKIAYEVSSHLNSLPLTNDQHNKLVELITKQVVEGEKTAFSQGISLGVRMVKLIGRGLEFLWLMQTASEDVRNEVKKRLQSTEKGGQTPYEQA
jgi:hypothetical protein